MENIKNWGAVLSIVAVICTLFEMFVPPGKISKSVYTVISLFAVLVSILPIFFLVGSFESEFKNMNFDCKKLKTSNELKENLESQVSDLLCEKVKVSLSDFLREIGAEIKKVEIFMDKQSDDCILMIRCRIYIEEKYKKFSLQIQNEVEKRLNIKTEVIEV